MKKKKTKKQQQKQKQLWFKASLVGLLALLMLLVWFGSGKPRTLTTSLSSDTKAAMPHDSGIRNVISPLLAEETFVLRFEDELPDPVYKNDTASKKSAPLIHEKRHQLALIIDDVGYDLHALRRLLELPFTLTVAILPDSPHAAEAARMAHQHGLKVMLHMPMQTSNPKYQQKMEHSYLHRGMTKKEFFNAFETALEKVPYVEGVNNHMGSLLTENKRSMQWLMELCKTHNLYFIDSRTSATSVAAASAGNAGIKWNERDIFLDHSVEADALQHAWESALHCVRTNDSCIMLAHPHPETLDFLERHAQGLSAQSFVAVDQLLKN